MEEERPVEDILDTIGDETARKILAEISKEPCSARELGDEFELSLPTVYRRLEDLEEYDLISDTTRISEDGNHHKIYTCNFDSTVIRLSDEQYDVRIYRRENLPDRFTQLWDDLGQA